MFRQCLRGTHFHSVNRYIYDYFTIQCYLMKDIIKRIGLVMFHFCRSDSFIGGENRSTQGNTPNHHLQSEIKLYRVNLAMCGDGTHRFGGDGHRLDRYKQQIYIRSRSRPPMIEFHVLPMIDNITYRTFVCQENYIIRTICLGYRFSLYFWVSDWILGRIWWCYFFPRFTISRKLNTDYAYISLIRKRFDYGL